MEKIEFKAFTLAEVVITLIVIGVVAAITVPMLGNDVNDKKWNVARQKAQATIGEAFKLATINGYVTPEYDNTKDFVTNVLTKYLKINKQCDTAQACGFNSSVKRADGSTYGALPTSWTTATMPRVLTGANGVNSTGAFNTVNGGIRNKFNNAAFFQTLDGFSVALLFNPYCATALNDKYAFIVEENNIVDYTRYSTDAVCMNAVYDMNGKKGPNRVGQDIGFVGSFWNGYNVKATAVLPYKEHRPANNTLPNSSGSNYWLRAHEYCRNIHDNDWKMPDVEELSLMYVNRNVIMNTNVSYYLWFFANYTWKLNSNQTFRLYFFNNGNGTDGVWYVTNKTASDFRVYCIRNTALK